MGWYLAVVCNISWDSNFFRSWLSKFHHFILLSAQVLQKCWWPMQYLNLPLRRLVKKLQLWRLSQLHWDRYKSSCITTSVYIHRPSGEECQNFDTDCYLTTYNLTVTLFRPVSCVFHTLITAFNGKLILFTEQMLIYFLCAFFCQLPTIIADNAGYDSADLVAKLRAAHTEGKKTYGLGKDFVFHNLSDCEEYDLIYYIGLARTATEQTEVKFIYVIEDQRCLHLYLI